MQISIKSLVLLLLVYTILGISIGIVFYPSWLFETESSVNAPIEDYTQCKNLSRDETASCLADYVSSFYIYRVTEQDVNFTELKEKGGDCLDWTRLYVDMSKNLGFVSKEIIIPLRNQSFSHAFAVFSDDSGYCIMDNEFWHCTQLNVDSLVNNTAKIQPV